MPPLGLCSGPNISFFSAVEHCRAYDTVLILETDCKIKSNCFVDMKKHIDTAGDFLVCGAQYDGRHYGGDIYSSRHTHLNGVAFYKTGSSEFQRFMSEVENWIAYNVQKGQSLPYDIAMTMFLAEQIKHNRGGSYRATLRKMIPTTLILNYSIDNASDTDFNYINTYFPNHKILHIKQS
jgi:hypothetical protein